MDHDCVKGGMNVERLTYRHEDQCGNPTNSISPALKFLYTTQEDWVKKVATRLALIEDILGDDYDLDRLAALMSQRMTMREDVAERWKLVGGIPLDHLRELVDADREGRVAVLPKDGMVYYIEEAGGEKWVANKPIQQITVKCGWGLASLEFSLLDTGKYFSRKAAEAALKGEQANGS